MAPFISPKKTWEGAVAGVAGAIIVSVLVVWYFDLPVAYWQAVILGFIISAFRATGRPGQIALQAQYGSEGFRTHSARTWRFS